MRIPAASVLVRGTILNLLGQVLPLLVALACLPIVVSHFGATRAGILALAWTVLGTAAAFDLGLGRASTRFLAAALARESDDRAPRILGTAVVGQLVLGVAAGFAIALAADPASQWFGLTADQRPEFVASLRLIGLGVPIVLLSSLFQGALSACHRFDLVNAVTVPSSSSVFVLTAAAGVAAWSVPAAVALAVGAKAAALVVLGRLTWRNCPGLRGRAIAADWETFSELAHFGSWIMLSSVLLPVLKQAERFLIPSMLSLQALTFYAVPYEAMSRAAIVPISMTTVLFPSFSRFNGDGGRELTSLVARPLRYLLVVMTPPLTFAGLFAHDVLALWMGPTFANQAAAALGILAAASYLNAFANLLRTAIQGMGRPDLKAILDLGNALLFIALLLVLVPRFGIAGAAAGRLIITIVEVMALSLFAWRVAPVAFGPRRLGELVGADFVLALAFVACSGLAARATRGSTMAYIVFATLVVAYLAAFWRFLADAKDRAAAAQAWSWMGTGRPAA